MNQEAGLFAQLKEALTVMESRQRERGGTACPGFLSGFFSSEAADQPPAQSAGADGGPGQTGALGSAGASGGSSGRTGRARRGSERGSRPGHRGGSGSGRFSEQAGHTPGRGGPWARVCRARADRGVGLEPLTAEWVDADALRLDRDTPGDGLGPDAGWIPDAAPEPCPDEPVGVLLDALMGMGLTGHQEAELVTAAEHLSAVRGNHDVMLVNVLAELADRGIQPPAGLSRVDWLRAGDPSLTGGQAKAFVTVATAITQPAWSRLRAAVCTQRITIAHAAQIIDFHERTHRLADPDELEAAVADLLAQAPGLRGEQLAKLVRHHTEQIRPPAEHQDADPDPGSDSGSGSGSGSEKREEARRNSRGLWFAAPNPTGMVRMSGILDPEAAAIIKTAIEALSEPCPLTDEHGHTIEPDPRTPAKRRADALVQIIRRGIASAESLPVTEATKVVVTMDLEALIGRLAGVGHASTGEVLSAATVRRMACDAGIIPMVLGTASEPLDLGRTKRLVTPGLRLALNQRDQGCTMPGCSVPAAWCHAHHTHHWSRGGRTSLLTTALLCPRHHTHVHHHDLTATVTASSVTWHV